MFDETRPERESQSLLSTSIWGNMILKLAYERDPELQKLRGWNKITDVDTATILGGAASGTLGQNIVAIHTLNPPDGLRDSYAPGIAGLALIGMTNIAIISRTGLNFGLRKKIRARQMAIRQRVETILNHLEYSEASCPEAQKELAEIIGDKAAEECIHSWTTSHAVAAVPGIRG
jgi:hypothetical protein